MVTNAAVKSLSSNAYTIQNLKSKMVLLVCKGFKHLKWVAYFCHAVLVLDRFFRTGLTLNILTDFRGK
jgi:hypothetical protein